MWYPSDIMLKHDNGVGQFEVQATDLKVQGLSAF